MAYARVCVCVRERETDLEGDDICKTRRFHELMSVCMLFFFWCGHMWVGEIANAMLCVCGIFGVI